MRLDFLANQIRQIDCFALDLDGTIYLDDKPIDGAVDFIAAVRASGRKLCFLTNNSSKSADDYVRKLAGMGIKADPETEIVTSGQATARYIAKEYPGKKVFLLGNDSLKKEFGQWHIPLAAEDAQIAVSAFDTSMTWQKTCLFYDLLQRGVPYIATHPDLLCPTKTGFVPDIGAIHAYFEAASGRRPDVIIGKPHGGIIDYLLEKSGATRENTALVGDRLYTDIAAAANNKLLGILVLSGETDREMAEGSAIRADIILASVSEITPYL